MKEFLGVHRPPLGLGSVLRNLNIIWVIFTAFIFTEGSTVILRVERGSMMKKKKRLRTTSKAGSCYDAPVGYDIQRQGVKVAVVDT